MEAGSAVASFDRTLVQRREALAKANAIRVWRAQMKRDLKAGRRRLVALIESPPEMLESMKIVDLLLATPKVGRVKSMKTLSRAHVAPSKAVGALSDRQRRELLALLR